MVWEDLALESNALHPQAWGGMPGSGLWAWKSQGTGAQVLKCKCKTIRDLGAQAQC